MCVFFWIIHFVKLWNVFIVNSQYTYTLWMRDKRPYIRWSITQLFLNVLPRYITEIKRFCHLATLSRINPKIEKILPMTAVHNSTVFTNIASKLFRSWAIRWKQERFSKTCSTPWWWYVCTSADVQGAVVAHVCSFHVQIYYCPDCEHSGSSFQAMQQHCLGCMKQNDGALGNCLASF